MNNRIKRILTVAIMVMALMVTAVLPSTPGMVLAEEQPYVFSPVDFPGATATVAMGINAGGDIVGYYYNTIPGFHGFLLRGGEFSTLDFPDNPGKDVAWTQANAISPAGDIVGTYSLKSNPDRNIPPGNAHGFLLTKKGVWSTVDYPIGNHLMAGGLMRILPDGTMLGCFHDVDTTTTPPTTTAMYGYVVGRKGTTAFEYPSSQPFSMHYGATPNGKTIVGMYRTGTAPGHWHGYLLENCEVISFDVPESTLTQAFDINPAGETIGTYTDSAGKMHGFLVETRGLAVEDWSFTTIDAPGATTSTSMTHLRGINAGGDIVGDYIGADGKTHGFLVTRTQR